MAIAFIKNKNKKNKIRKGRGNSSGKGGESGRGHKGQKSRSGYSRMSGFEGGQTPLYRRLPKANGFKNKFKANFNIINIDQLNIFDNGKNITFNDLLDNNLIYNKFPIKILGRGILTKKITIVAKFYSKSAKLKIEKNKGSIKNI